MTSHTKGEIMSDSIEAFAKDFRKVEKEVADLKKEVAELKSGSKAVRALAVVLGQVGKPKTAAKKSVGRPKKTAEEKVAKKKTKKKKAKKKKQQRRR